jgi:type I restriction enzyme M protein
LAKTHWLRIKERKVNPMLTGKLRNQVDKIWLTFHTGGVANPISVIEQFTYLLFIRRLDEIHTRYEKLANSFGTPIKSPIFTPAQAASAPNR